MNKDIRQLAKDYCKDEANDHSREDCSYCIKDFIAGFEAAAPQKGMPDDEFQFRVHGWMLECFGPEIAADITERNHRFFEEATELVQTTGMTKSECLQLVDYVFSRPVGETTQEIGGVMVTLAALCNARIADMNKCGETELNRVWGKIDAIRKKQAAKPKHSPLPVAESTTDTIAAVSSKTEHTEKLTAERDRYKALYEKADNYIMEPTANKLSDYQQLKEQK